MRRELPWRELQDWVRYFHRKPMPQQRGDYLLGQIAAQLNGIKNIVLSAAGGKAGKAAAFDDFAFWLKKAKPAPKPRAKKAQPMTDDEIKADMAMWAGGFNRSGR